MSAWISNGLYVLAALAVAFWGWKRHKKGGWFFVLLVFGLMAFESVAVEIWKSRAESLWLVVTLPITMGGVLTRFAILWLIWFCVGRAVLTLGASAKGKWPMRFDAARWFAPVVVLALAFISPWQITVFVTACCLMSPLLARVWVRKTDHLDRDQLTG